MTTSRGLLEWILNMGVAPDSLIPDKYGIKVGGATIDTPFGTLRHVDNWNEFNEGNEEIYVVCQLDDGDYFRLHIYNDSWSTDNYDDLTLQGIEKVAPVEVKKIEWRSVYG